MTKKYGYYSQQAADQYQQSPASDGRHNQRYEYNSPNGVVIITGVGYSPDPATGGYGWADAIYMGEVTNFIRSIP